MHSRWWPALWAALALLNVALPAAMAAGSSEAEVRSQPAAPAGYEQPFKYIGNSFSHKFHRPSCPFAKAMWTSRMELFHWRKEAIAGGYQPCNYCLPKVWTRVYARIKSLPAKPAALPDSATPRANN